MNSFPMQGVSVIGLKFDGIEGSSRAELLPISLIAAIFQSFGTTEFDQQLNRSFKAKRSVLNFLKMI